MNRIILYSKPGCHLCEHLKEDLGLLGSENPFVLCESNIEDDPTIYERFQYLIPVLELPDGTLLYPPHDIRQIRVRLAGLSPDPNVSV